MLVLGSCLEVTPASEIPLIALRCGAKAIVVNYQTTSLDSQADVIIHEDVAEVLPQILRECRDRANFLDEENHW